MRTTRSTLTVAGLLATLLAACTDVPDPVGPLQLDALPRVSPHDGPPQWFETASPVVLDMPGAVFADQDEATGRLVFGAEHPSAVNRIRATVRRMGIPDNAFEIRVVPPIHQLATQQLPTLLDPFRPTVAGIQIHFHRFVCTLGFNADAGGERSFFTASHCTRRQGGVEKTPYYQPLSNVDPTVIAVEVEDPKYFNRRNGCPQTRKCRFSDAARARYSSGTPSERGLIAQTAGPNTGSLEVTGALNVVAQSNEILFAPGTVVGKVGRTTGWTEGQVVASCATVNVGGTNFTQICQTVVQASNPLLRIAGGGDSGSPVFISGGGNDVELIGILWGATVDGNLFVFSPLPNVEFELGPFNAVR